MINGCIKALLFVLLSILLFAEEACARETAEEAHIKVALRMIGHQVLLQSGDSTSRVLAIEKVQNRYKIPFESDFSFDPDELATAVNKLVEETKIAKSYLVEIERCGTKEVIYSYEVGHLAQTDLIPCRGRVQPSACYSLFITILDPGGPVVTTFPATPASPNSLPTEEKQLGYANLAWLSIPLLVLLGWMVYTRQKGARAKTKPDVFSLGAYRFDKRNMMLLHKHEKTELTSKEADLLYLLYTSENKVLERSTILENVWGDQGDYVGRTLDVFMSKLRKKLAADTNLRIINVRGIGYKFVMGE